MTWFMCPKCDSDALEWRAGFGECHAVALCHAAGGPPEVLAVFYGAGDAPRQWAIHWAQNHFRWHGGACPMVFPMCLDH